MASYDSAYTYAKPFDCEEGLNQKTVFLYRVIKKKLEDELGFELEDYEFISIMHSAYGCNGSGPIPFGPAMGLPRALEECFRKLGYPNEYAKSVGNQACDFFFGDTGVFREDSDYARVFDNIILHIPHAGTDFVYDSSIRPTDSSANPKDPVYIQNAKDVIDWYTDELFAPKTENERILPVVFPYCRTYCDVERMIVDPLEKVNLGICYDGNDWKKKNGFFSHNGKSSGWRDQRPVNKLYLDHHYKMSKLLTESFNPLLIDCHSFSSRPTPIMPDYDKKKEVDICIGFNDDDTKPEGFVISTICHHFRMLGYTVGVNVPFSNSKTFDTPAPYKSIMIEVNKKLYMNEDTLEKTEGFEKLQRHIGYLYVLLLTEK